MISPGGQMWPYIYLIFHDVTAICGGVYLISKDHPWWAALCFFLTATTTIKSQANKPLETDGQKDGHRSA